MSEIDWSKAPDGATHAGFDWKGKLRYFYRIPGVQLDYDYWSTRLESSEWVCGKGVPAMQKLIPRPSAWSGDGLPPMGAYIEWLSDQYGWLGGRVVGHDGMVTVVSHNDGYTGCHAHEVRPIRTPEQIAAEERCKAIHAIELHILKAQEQYLSVVQTAQSIYDAGFQVPKQ